MSCVFIHDSSELKKQKPKSKTGSGFEFKVLFTPVLQEVFVPFGPRTCRGDVTLRDPTSHPL